MKRALYTGSSNGNININDSADTNNESKLRRIESPANKNIRTDTPMGSRPRPLVRSRVRPPLVANISQTFLPFSGPHTSSTLHFPTDQLTIDASVPAIDPATWLPADVVGIIRRHLDFAAERNWRLVDKRTLALYDENFPEIKETVRLDSVDQYLESRWPSNGSRCYQRNTDIHGAFAATPELNGKFNKRLKFKEGEFEGLIAKIVNMDFISSQSKAKLLFKMQLGIKRIPKALMTLETKRWLRAIDALSEADFVAAFPSVLWRHDETIYTPSPRARFLRTQHRLAMLSENSLGSLFLTLSEKPWELETVFFELMSHVEKVPASALPNFLARYWQVPWQLGNLNEEDGFSAPLELEKQWEVRWNIFAAALLRVPNDSTVHVLLEAVAALPRIPPVGGIRVRFLQEVLWIMKKFVLTTDELEAPYKIFLTSDHAVWPSDEDKILIEQLDLYIPKRKSRSGLARKEIDQWKLAVDNPNFQRENLNPACLRDFLIDFANSAKPDSRAIGLDMLERFEASCQTGSFATHLLKFQGTFEDRLDIREVFSDFQKAAGIREGQT